MAFLGDKLAPRSAVDDMSNRLAPGCVERWHLSPAQMGLRDVDHFRWTRGGAAFAPLLADWIRSALEPPMA